MPTFDLDTFYDGYPRVEEEFQARLEDSLQPRGPEQIYQMVSSLGLAPGARGLDVGCGEGDHTVELATRFGLEMLGIDPVSRHIELARSLGSDTRFEVGTAEALPVEDGSVDLVWCKDVLVHVSDLDRAYAEFQRVLRPGGKALVYQMFGTGLLEEREADWLWTTMGVVPSSAEPERTEQAVAAAGLRVQERIELGSEWGEYFEERRGMPGRKLLYAARLLRAPEGFIAAYGQANYDIMLGDCLWHIYRMIGKLSPRIYLLSKPG